MGFHHIAIAALAALASAAPAEPRAAKPKSFLKELGNSTWIIGNSIWNMTQGRQYGVKLMYRGKDRVGPTATGHYVSYSELVVYVERIHLTTAQMVHNPTSIGHLRRLPILAKTGSTSNSLPKKATFTG